MAAAALWWLGFGDGVVGIIEREMKLCLYVFCLCVWCRCDIPKKTKTGL